MSWYLFFICVFGLAAALMLPALIYLPFTGIGAKQVLAISPISTSLVIAICGVALHALGLKVGYLPFYCIVILVSMLLGGVFYGVRGRLALPKLSYKSLKSAVPVFVALSVGLLVTAYVYCRGIGSPDAFLQIYDNSFHLGVVKSMSASSDFSVLGVGPYLESNTSSFNPNPGGGFYPASWHIIAALVAQVASIPVTAAMNVTNFVFVGFVLPLGIQALVSSWTDDDFDACVCAAIVTLAFTAFPWSLTYWGPVYPNLAAFCSVPAVAAVFQTGLTQTGADAQPVPVSHFVVGILGIASLALLQPNAVFTLGIWLVPAIVNFAVSVFDRHCSERLRHQSAAKLLVRIGVFCLIALIWIACYKSSFMRSVVEFSWPSFTYVFDAVRRAVTLCYLEKTVEIPLAILVAIGCWRCLSDRRFSGLFYCLLFANALFIVDAVNDGGLRHLLTGFWYTDQHRVAAMASLFAIPVAAMGLSAVVRAARQFAHSLVQDDSEGCASSLATLFLLGVVFCLLYWPDNVNARGEEELTPLGSIKSINGYMYNYVDINNNLTYSESEFLDRVKQIVGDDLIINDPYDGSSYGYALDGLNLMYRQFGLAGDGETDASRLIRTSLASISSNGDVESAVDQSGAKYLLVLDYGADGREGADLPGYDRLDWAGIDSVTDETPGFEVLLSDRDMRLYRISTSS